MLKEMRRKTSRMTVSYKYDAAMKKAKYVSGALLPMKTAKYECDCVRVAWTGTGILHTLLVTYVLKLLI